MFNLILTNELKKIVYVIILVIGVFSGQLSQSQDKYKWIQTTTDSFILNFYELNNPEIKALSMFCEAEFERITGKLNYAPSKRLTIYFKSTSTIKRELLLGKNDILSKKFYVNLSGVTEEIPGEISIKISQLVIGDMLERKGLRKVPDWYYYGGVAYFADNASLDSLSLDDMWRDETLDDLEGMEAMIAGNQVFQCMEVNYGNEAIANTFNLTRILFNEKKAITNILGIVYTEFLEECNINSSK
ncbi:hypothetical protein ACFLU5_06530 [Bacteroidota bacterium]